MNMLNFFTMLGCMIVFDRAFPWTMMTYGVNIFPWAEADRTRVMLSYYGWLKFPRSLVAFVLLPVAVALPIKAESLQLFIGSALVIAWCALAFRDLWMGKAVMETVDGDANDHGEDGDPLTK